ncbi:MAG: PIN domain-containing protein [Chitinophagaceae bacterium]|nr:PIN domain-containing protein [Chitinophagaceae bacterium]
MTSLFLDTNIIIDLVGDRKPFSKFAIEIFALAEKGDVELYTSSHSIATTHYVLKKFVDEKKLRKILLSLLDYLSPVAVSEDILRESLSHSFSDFEDGIQMICASSTGKMDFIITRNKKHFKESTVQVLEPDEILERL